MNKQLNSQTVTEQSLLNLESRLQNKGYVRSPSTIKDVKSLRPFEYLVSNASFDDEPREFLVEWWADQ